jgi:hypothetical protein
MADEQEKEEEIQEEEKEEEIQEEKEGEDAGPAEKDGDNKEEDEVGTADVQKHTHPAATAL